MRPDPQQHDDQSEADDQAEDEQSPGQAEDRSHHAHQAASPARSRGDQRLIADAGQPGEELPAPMQLAQEALTLWTEVRPVELVERNPPPRAELGNLDLVGSEAERRDIGFIPRDALDGAKVGDVGWLGPAKPGGVFRVSPRARASSRDVSSALWSPTPWMTTIAPGRDHPRPDPALSPCSWGTPAAAPSRLSIDMSDSSPYLARSAAEAARNPSATAPSALTGRRVCARIPAVQGSRGGHSNGASPARSFHVFLCSSFNFDSALVSASLCSSRAFFVAASRSSW